STARREVTPRPHLLRARREGGAGRVPRREGRRGRSRHHRADSETQGAPGWGGTMTAVAYDPTLGPAHAELDRERAEFERKQIARAEVEDRKAARTAEAAAKLTTVEPAYLAKRDEYAAKLQELAALS